MRFIDKNITLWSEFPSRLLMAMVFLLLAISPATEAAKARSYPNVPLINQDGETLHFYDDVIKGKVVTISFMFTSCPDACPLETAKLRAVQKQLGDHVGKDIFMYSISIDPERDTPEALKAYMKKFNIGPGWQFLTGKQADIDLIRKKMGMLNYDEKELSDHNINFIMGNEVTGHWVRRTPFDVPESLVATLLTRLQPASLLAKKADYAESTKHKASRPGEDLFLTRCTACHTIGEGDKSGPDLLNIADNRDRDWLVRWIKEPDVMLKEKDPMSMALYEKYNKLQMPNLRLTDEDANNLLDFIEVVSKRVSGVSAEQVSDNSDKTGHSHHMH